MCDPFSFIFEIKYIGIFYTFQFVCDMSVNWGVGGGALVFLCGFFFNNVQQFSNLKGVKI